MRVSFTGRLITTGLALAALAACPHEGGAAGLALSCGDPQPVASERPMPKAGPIRKTLDVEVDTAAETMRVDDRVSQLKAMPDRFVGMGPLTRTGGLAHYEYLVVDRATNDARLGEMSPEGVAWGVVRYRCEPRKPAEGEAEKGSR